MRMGISRKRGFVARTAMRGVDFSYRARAAGLRSRTDASAQRRTTICPVRLKYLLQAMAEDRLPARFAITVGPLEDFANAALFPTEMAANTGASPRRLAAFRGGRACARAALRELGLPPAAIPTGACGAPIWPEGFIGSISHTDDIAAAIVAHSPPIRGLGLDLDGNEPLDDAAMVQLVCRPEELFPDRDPSHPANLQRGKLLFVVKEAVYKLYWPLADRFLDFQDVCVTLDESASAFHAELVDSQLPGLARGRAVNGSFARSEGLLVALASWHC